MSALNLIARKKLASTKILWTTHFSLKNRINIFTNHFKTFEFLRWSKPKTEALYYLNLKTAKTKSTDYPLIESTISHHSTTQLFFFSLYSAALSFLSICYSEYIKPRRLIKGSDELPEKARRVSREKEKKHR